MRRHLSQTLILIVMLLSPLTFSTNKVPNFAPDCEIQAACREKTSQATAAIRSTAKPPWRHHAAPAVMRFALSPPTTPHAESLRIPSSSRAPPLAHSILS